MDTRHTPIGIPCTHLMVEIITRNIFISLDGIDSGFSITTRMELYSVVLCAHASIFSVLVMVFFDVDDGGDSK